MAGMELDYGSASSQWDGMVDRDGDGIPDGAEISRTIQAQRPDGASVTTKASWTKGATPMRFAEDMAGDRNANTIANYPRAGSGVTANKYRAAIFAAPSTNTIQGRARFEAANTARMDRGQMALISAGEQNANRELALALEQSRGATARETGRMKLAGDEAMARSNDLAAQYQAQSNTLKAVLESAKPPPIGWSPRGDFITQGNQLVAMPEKPAGPITQQIDPNTGATLLIQDGRLIQTLAKPRETDGYPAPAAAATASPASAARPMPQGQTRDSLRARLKAANQGLSDAELDAYLMKTYGV